MRLKIIKFFYIFILIIIVIRLFYWQVIRFDDLSILAERQHMVSLQLDGPRGLIFASDGEIMASNQPSYLLSGLPKIIKNKEEVALKLASILIKKEDKISSTETENQKTDQKKVLNLKDELVAKLSQDLYWVILDKNIDLSTKQEIEKLKIEGIAFENQSSRFYPEASSAAHILGFVGSDSSGKQIGYFGIEGFYNGHLKGVGGIVTEEKDARGLPILMGRFKKREPKSGHNIILNIDRTVQYIVEKKLKAGMERYGAKAALAMVMEPKTGAILAMVTFPNYDPNVFAKFPKEYYKNSAVADSYEPGSTFKTLIVAAAINENSVTPEMKCDICSGPVQISGYQIRTWNNKYYPETTIRDVIVHSDNVGMVFVGRKLGMDKMYQYLQDFGLGALTQIDLQDESSPDIKPKHSWKEIDLATTSFGQGIAVTPIQIVRAVSTLANGGFLMEPHIVKAIQIDDKLIKIEPKVVKRPISQTTAETITQMMVEAVEKGEARVFAPQGYKIAGKTGTAQIPVAGHYDPNKTIASFVGFAPANDPKFVVLVRYDEPSASIFGAETAAPTFFEIAKELLIYYNIAPE